jgi:beta-lactamase class A
MTDFRNYVLDRHSVLDEQLQRQLEKIDHVLRTRYQIPAERTAVGVLDLIRPRLAMVQPDRLEYGASLPKIGILLAYFHLHSQGVTHLSLLTRHELGLMIKASSNEMATQFSSELGLARIQEVLHFYSLYDPSQGGGIWMGKHYGENSERIGDPLGNYSHAVTVRQLLRFYLLLEQGQLVSSAASAEMREIFVSRQIPHDPIKFVRGLEKRGVELIRKWGSWEDWFHDSAVVLGPGRHYILVGLTHHPKGDDYLVQLAKAVDDCLAPFNTEGVKDLPGVCV